VGYAAQDQGGLRWHAYPECHIQKHAARLVDYSCAPSSSAPLSLSLREGDGVARSLEWRAARARRCAAVPFLIALRRRAANGAPHRFIISRSVGMPLVLHTILFVSCSF